MRQGDTRSNALPGLRCFRLPVGRELLSHLTGTGGYFFRLVIVHHNHGVRNIQVIPAAAHDQNGGNAKPAVHFLHAVNKGGNGFVVFPDQGLHPGIPHHEVGRRGVFVHQQQATPRFQCFHNIGSLAGTATGIFGAEIRGGAPKRQVGNKGTDVHLLHPPTVFCTDFHRRRERDHIFPPVSRNVGVYPPFQRAQQGGFPVVPAAHNQGHARGNSHAGNGALVSVGAVQGIGQGNAAAQR